MDIFFLLLGVVFWSLQVDVFDIGKHRWLFFVELFIVSIPLWGFIYTMSLFAIRYEVSVVDDKIKEGSFWEPLMKDNEMTRKIFKRKFK